MSLTSRELILMFADTCSLWFSLDERKFNRVVFPDPQIILHISHRRLTRRPQDSSKCIMSDTSTDIVKNNLLLNSGVFLCVRFNFCFIQCLNDEIFPFYVNLLAFRVCKREFLRFIF